jgi:hypothetical protein
MAAWAIPPARAEPPCVGVLRGLAVVLIVLGGACIGGAAGEAADRQIRVVEQSAVYAGPAAELDRVEGVDALGIRTVLDLDQENPADRPRVSRDHAMARGRAILFVHLPLDPVTAPSLAELEAAVDVLRERRFQPILVHADHSDHRTRLVIAAFRVRVQGWAASRAADEMGPDSWRRPWLRAWRDRLFEYAALPRSGRARAAAPAHLTQKGVR